MHLIGPEAEFDTKARHLRALYRDSGGEPSFPRVKAEYHRLFPGERDKYELAQILSTAWTEGRALAGHTYDSGMQCWRDADGNRID